MQAHSPASSPGAARSGIPCEIFHSTWVIRSSFGRTFCPRVQRKAVHDRNCSRLWATSYINIESNHLSFISYNDCNYHQAVIWEHPAAVNRTSRSVQRQKCSENPPFSDRKHLQDSRKQKITVVEIVSTTVTDLVAEEGFEPTTFGL